MNRFCITAFRHIGFAGLLALISTVCWEQASAQVDWTRKHFMQWDRKDIERVMNDSPWVNKKEVRMSYEAQTGTIAGGVAGPEGAFVRSANTTAALGGARAPLDFTFTLRLRSGLPVRAAVLRAKQLEANYDQMGENERAGFDAKWNGILQCPACANNYVLTLSSSSKEQPGADAVFTVFKGGRLADLQRYVYIANEHGERRSLVHFVPPKAPGEEALFYFARYDEKGAPLFNAKSRQLVFNVTNNEVSLVVNFRVDISRLLIDGEVSF